MRTGLSRFLSVLLCVIMLFGMIAAASGEDVPATGGKMKFNTEEDGIKDGVLPNRVILSKKGVVNLPIGQTLTLSVTLKPSGATSGLAWTSSNPNVATVNDGVVEALSGGTAKITVTTDNNKKASVKIKVLQPVTELKVSGSQLLYWKKSTKLSLTVVPFDATNKKVKWTSSNPALAKVNKNGKVTAKKVQSGGIVTITATAKDSSGVSGSLDIAIVGKDGVIPDLPDENSIVITSVKPSVTQGYPGTTVVWQTAASGGVGDLKYAYTLYKDGAELFKGDRASNEFNYTLNETGSYTLNVAVSDSEGRNASKTSEAVTIVPAPIVLTVTPDKALEHVGKEIKWTTRYARNTRVVNYAYTLFKDGAELIKQDSASELFAYTPAEKGLYKLQADIVDEEGETESAASVEVVIVPAPALIADDGDDVSKIDPISDSDVQTQSVTIGGSAINIEYVNGQIIAVAKLASTFEDISRQVAEYGGYIVGYLSVSGDYQVQFDGKTYAELEDITRAMEASGLYVEDSVVVHTVQKSGIDAVASEPVTPNDQWGEGSNINWSEDNPSGNNWGVERIKARLAWRYKDEIEAVRIGVIDGGCYSRHEDIKFSVVGDRLDSDHGMHVMGIIAAKQNNEIGVTGVAWNKTGENKVFITALSKDTNGYNSILRWKKKVADLVIEKNVKVINISMGWNDDYKLQLQSNSALIEEQTNYANSAFGTFFRRMSNVGHDFVVCKSAGNGFDNGVREARINDYFSICTDNDVRNRVIVVGACDVNDSIASFSQRGSRVDVYAPGFDIYSSVGTSRYEKMSGTSMATPHVTGVAALVWGANPNLSGAQVKQAITNTTDGSLGGCGILDANAAVEKAREMGGIVNPPAEKTGVVMGRASAIDVSGNESYYDDIVVSAYKQDTGAFVTSDKTIALDGGYSLILPVGTYKLVASKEHYEPVTVENIVVQEDEVVYQDFVLTDSDQNARVSGYVTDAATGGRLADVTVQFRAGLGTRTGDYVPGASTTTDINGFYSTALAFGSYTAEFTLNGYSTAYLNVVVSAASVEHADCSLSPIMADGLLRVILAWGAEPHDLDLHMTGPASDGSRYHIFYYDMTHYENGVRVANLDVDDTESYGPETITVEVERSGEYTFYVHDYSNKEETSSTAMCDSGATVTVYKGSTQLRVFRIPSGTNGTVWKVFTYDGERIIGHNTMSYEEDAGDVGKGVGGLGEEERALFRNLPEK